MNKKQIREELIDVRNTLSPKHHIDCTVDYILTLLDKQKEEIEQDQYNKCKQAGDQGFLNGITYCVETLGRYKHYDLIKILFDESGRKSDVLENIEKNIEELQSLSKDTNFNKQ